MLGHQELMSHLGFFAKDYDLEDTTLIPHPCPVLVIEGNRGDGVIKELFLCNKVPLLLPPHPQDTLDYDNPGVEEISQGRKISKGRGRAGQARPGRY